MTHLPERYCNGPPAECVWGLHDHFAAGCPEIQTNYNIGRPAGICPWELQESTGTSLLHQNLTLDIRARRLLFQTLYSAFRGTGAWGDRRARCGWRSAYALLRFGYASPNRRQESLERIEVSPHTNPLAGLDPH